VGVFQLEIKIETANPLKTKSPIPTATRDNTLTERMSPFAYNDGKWHINEKMNVVNTPDGKLLDGKTIDTMWRVQWGIPMNVTATLTVKTKMLATSFAKKPVGIAFFTAVRPNETTGTDYSWHTDDDDELIEDEGNPDHYISLWIQDIRTQLREAHAKANAEAEDVETINEVSNEVSYDPSNEMD